MHERFSIHRLAAALVPVVAALGSQAVLADASGPRRAVGEITLSVGPVTRTSAQGVPERVTRGSPIAPGDRLDTAEGGHVHIRFVDGALVSVRPGSRLWVEDYRYEPNDVSKSLVRFKLEYGVARAISGAAAEGAKDRFRLNTPLVAIGVRGTDFVVRSGQDGSSATVNQGAIVMAPFDDTCKDVGLGPCRSTSARLLAADMGRLLVEFQARAAQPEIRPVGGTTFIAGSTPDNGQGPRPAPLPTVASASPRSDDVLPDAVAHGAVASAIDVGAATPPPPPPPSPPAPPAPTPTPPAPPPPAPAPSAPASLVWGRWAAMPADGGDFSIRQAEAAQGRTFIAGNTRYLLYRDESGGSVLAPGLGTYSFTLDQGHASFQKGSQFMPAQVTGGQLSIDFNRRRFDTQLQVTSDPTGLVTIVGGGQVQRDGKFMASSAGQTIDGATAIDGTSAGYLFRRAIGGGSLTGITLWSRP